LSWCDKLASVPGVGFKIDTHFAPSDTILNGLSPILDPLVKGDKTQFDLTLLQPYEIAFRTEDGFEYGVGSSKVSVTFKHRLRAKAQSAGPPVMEMLSHPMPFTQLLPEISKRLIELTLLVPKSKERSVTRVGVISTTVIAEGELPPGIVRFIKYVGRPWKNMLDHYNINITADLGKGGGWTDRCIHTLTKSEDREQLLSLNFDWQRTFASGRSINSPELADILESAERSALRYFEDLAEGGRFDEEIISGATAAI
jgi:hypothetical protein